MQDPFTTGPSSGPVLTVDAYFIHPECSVATELVQGRIVPVEPLGFRRGVVAARIRRLVQRHAILHDRGSVFGPECGFAVGYGPDTVRRTEVAFVRKPRLLEPVKAHLPCDGAPDLAVRVARLGEGSGDSAEWVRDHLDAGCGVVWVIRPDEGHWTVHTREGVPRIWGVDDVVSGGEVLPGLECVVREIVG